MNRRNLILAGTTAIFLVSCTSISPPSIPCDAMEFSRRVDQLSADILDKRKIRGGLSVGIYSRGEVLVSRGYGFADYDGGQRITERTPMPVGSVSKTFTALGIMQLVEQGRVRLDDPISKYLPDLILPDNVQKKITLEMLLTHRGGIQGDILADFITREAVDPSEFQRSLLIMLGERPLLFEPGKLFSYSNASFALLGIIIEEISGLSYPDYIRKNIFEPAGMDDSLVYPAEGGTEVPLGYGMGKPQRPPQIRDMAAGSLLISSRDMMRFVDALFSGKIVASETWRDMVSPHNTGNPIDRSFSIGLSYWLINPMGTEDLIAAHGGDLPPYQALLVILPDRKSAVFTAANDIATGDALAVKAGVELMKELLVYEEGRSLETFQTAPQKNLGFTGDPDQFTGIYNTLVGPMEVEGRKGKLTMKIMGIKLHLVKDDLGWWKPQVRILGIPIKIAFLEALAMDLFTVEGESWLGLWSGGIYGGAYRKIDDPGKPSEFAGRVGTWKAVDPSRGLKEVKISEKRDYYLLSLDFIGNPIKVILDPLSPDEAIIAGEGRFMGDRLVFSCDGDRAVLKYSGLLFERAD